MNHDSRGEQSEFLWHNDIDFKTWAWRLLWDSNYESKRVKQKKRGGRKAKCCGLVLMKQKMLTLKG